MGLTVVLGLTILCAANYGNAFEFSGLNPLAYNKAPFKSGVKSFSPPTKQPQQGEQEKSAFDNKNVAPKPYAFAPEPFKQPYQHFQQEPFRGNYQPFGPYPGYPGPVVYSGPGGYPGPAYAPAPYFNDPNQKPFGFQPFPSPAQPPFGSFKYGPKKVNKNLPGSADFNQPGKYFQEHQFGAYHGPEFTAAIVPAEHNIKQYKPKDSVLGKPIVPSEAFLKDYELPKQGIYGFGPPPSFGYPVQQFPTIQPFVNTVTPKKSEPALVPEDIDQRFGGVVVTTASSPHDETATSRSEEAAVETSSTTPVADPLPAADTDASRLQQPGSPSQEEVTPGVAAAAEVATNNEAPAPAADDAAAKEQSEQSNAAEANEPADAGAGAVDSETPAKQANDAQVSGKDTPLSPVVVEEVKSEETPAAAVPAELPKSDEVKESVAVTDLTEDVKNAEEVNATPTESAAAAVSDSEGAVEKSEEVKENKPVEPAEKKPQADKPANAPVQGAFANFPGLPNELYAPITLSDPSSAGFFGSSGFPFAGQQPSYLSFPSPNYSEEEFKRLFAGQLDPNYSIQMVGSSFSQTQFVQSADPAVKTNEATGSSVLPENNVSTESSLSASSTPSTENAEKKDTAGPESRNEPETPKKSSTVQIIEDDFAKQIPLSNLYDPANITPLDSYRFYSHPSVSTLSSQASLASYSPEEAFAAFGGDQFRQGYFVQGSPSLIPMTKTVVQTGVSPLSISSKDHPLHSVIFKYPTSFVPYPGLVTGASPAAFRSIEVTSTAVPATVLSSTVAPAEVLSEKVAENSSDSTTTEKV